jgi:predicted MFS family arabinose efflux permease
MVRVTGRSERDEVRATASDHTGRAHRQRSTGSGRSAGAARAARAVGRGSAVTGRRTVIAARAGARRVRRATHAQGAGESGLGKLIELSGVNGAGDALVTLALAGTLFFSVPVGEARGQVALYLLVTMAPFALLAPVVGPVLDRLRSGRRYAMAATFLLRALLALVMADAISGETQDALRLFPAAFGVLVLSRAYGVARAAVVPRVLPPGMSLVKANSRTSMAGLAAMGVAIAIGAGIGALFGDAWGLRLAALIFLGGAVLAVRLPRRADSSQGETSARLSDAPEPDGRPRRWNVGPAVVHGLRCNAALRAFSGFLTLYLAFLLREQPVAGLGDATALGLIVGAAAVGSGIGTALGNVLRDRSPELNLLVLLAMATASSAVGAWLYGAITLVTVAFVAGLAQSLGKLSLDSLIQTSVPESVRTSAFARSETLLQLSWVLGGGLGTLLPLPGAPGLAIAAAGLGAALVVVVRAYLRGHRRTRAR